VRPFLRPSLHCVAQAKNVPDQLQKTRGVDYGGAREIALPTKEEFEAESQVPAFLKAIMVMAEGDSVTVFESIPDEHREQLPEGF